MMAMMTKSINLNKDFVQAHYWLIKAGTVLQIENSHDQREKAFRMTAKDEPSKNWKSGIANEMKTLLNHHAFV